LLETPNLLAFLTVAREFNPFRQHHFPWKINAVRGRAHSGDARARSDFADISPHRAPVAETVPKRPYRPRFFETFARALNLSVDRLIRTAE
jgi:hypothetical protein